MTLGTAFNLIRLSSTKQIVNPRTASNFENVVLFGDVAYNATIDDPEVLKTDSDTKRSSTFSKLHGTKEEIENIAKTLTENDLKCYKYMGAEASEESFSSMLNKDPDIVHIASHAFYLEPTAEDSFFFSDLEGLIEFKNNEDPMFRSGLALTGANYYWRYGETMSENIKDGILTAKELGAYDLRNVDLMVLSACETGIGKTAGNEGVYGLQRGVKKAGVNHMILSLWKVDDAKTKEYMSLFYENLVRRKLDIQVAYSTTQKEFKGKYPEPYYWGAFVLIK